MHQSLAEKFCLAKMGNWTKRMAPARWPHFRFNLFLHESTGALDCFFTHFTGKSSGSWWHFTIAFQKNAIITEPCGYMASQCMSREFGTGIRWALLVMNTNANQFLIAINSGHYYAVPTNQETAWQWHPPKCYTGDRSRCADPSHLNPDCTWMRLNATMWHRREKKAFTTCRCKRTAAQPAASRSSSQCWTELCNQRNVIGEKKCLFT